MGAETFLFLRLILLEINRKANAFIISRVVFLVINMALLLLEDKA